MVGKGPAFRAILAVAGLLLVTAATGCGILSPNEPTDETQNGSSAAAVAETSNTLAGIKLRARLAFPHRAELTFDRAGEVEEVLVSQGERVEKGQVLARLNSDRFPALEEEIARLEYQIAEARENIRLINQDYQNEPLLAAQREETAARLELANTQAEDFIEDIDQNYADLLTAAISERDQAESALDAALDARSDAERDLAPNQVQVVAAAEQAKADAELALDRAVESLGDYKENLSDEAIRAADRVTGAELALDQARERLADYQEDLQESVIPGRDRVTKAELTLDLAQERLADFLSEHDRRVIRARTAVGAAEEAVDAAQIPLTAFLREPIRDLQADGKPVDIAKLRTLEAAVALAEANLTKAREDLGELEEGPDPFRVQELRSNIAVAELSLAQAKDDLTELEEGPDRVLLQELESNVTVAELNLSKTKEALEELEEGPDLLVLNQLEAQVELARVNRSQAEKRLGEALEGPDRLILPRLELNVTLAQQRLDLAERRVQELRDDGPDRKSVPLMEKEIASRLQQIEDLYTDPDAVKLAQIESLNAAIALAQDRIGDIREEMEEYSLVAPFDGVIYLVNVEEDDRVGKDSRVMELLDPDEVVIKGFVDATEVRYVEVGSRTLVSLDSAPGQEFSGVVSYVSPAPLTERGIISYAVEIEFDPTPGLDIPLRLSAVEAVVLP